MASLLVVTVQTLNASGADDLAACEARAPGAISVRSDGWSRIRLPKYDVVEGPARVTSFTPSQGLPNRMYASNGEVIKVTGDAGCTWNNLWTGYQPEAPVDQAGHNADNITHLASPANNALWVAAYDSVQGVAHPRAYILDLGSNGTAPEPPETVVDNGLPPVGKPVGFDVAGGFQVAAYMLVETIPDVANASTDNAREIYTTYIPSTPPEAGAAGTMWKGIPTPEDLGPVAGIRAPYNRTLWAWSGDTFAVTTNSAADEVTWKTGTVPGEIVTLDVGPTGRAMIVTKTEQGTVGVEVEYTGKIVRTVTFPIAPTEIAFGNRSGVMAVSGPAGTWGFDVELGRWVDITPKGAGPLGEMSFANGATTRYVIGQSKDAFFRYDLFRGIEELFRLPPPPPKWSGDLNFGTIPRSNLKNVIISPESQEVTVEPGKLVKEPVTLRVPPAPNPLDVFFVMDTTGSMGQAIAGLRDSVVSIATGLREVLHKDREVCFGVGDVKDDQPVAGVTSGESAVSIAYRTRQKITCNEPPALPTTKSTIAQLKSSAGGDIPEAQTIALTQAVTGKGMTPPSDPFYILPNQDAGFRAEALKVIVLISDANFNEGGGYPTISEAIDTLNSADVKVVNVLVNNGGEGFEPGRQDMTEVALGTDTLAPAGGVDCDGDGKHTAYDLDEGDPLVCETSGSEPNIGGAVLGLLMAVKDPGTIAVEVDDPARVTKTPDGDNSAVRNLKRESRLSFALPLSCTKAQDGLNLPVKLVPTVRGAWPRGVMGEILVKCRAQPVPPPPPPPVPDPIPEIVKPRPPQVLVLQPPPQPPVQPVSNINLNAGFSQQEEQQFQLAAVTQGAQENEEEAEEVELAMSALPRPERDVASAAAMLTGATLLSTAVGVAYRRRLQRATRVQQVRIR